jgi:hypothetical protein
MVENAPDFDPRKVDSAGMKREDQCVFVRVVLIEGSDADASSFGNARRRESQGSLLLQNANCRGKNELTHSMGTLLFGLFSWLEHDSLLHLSELQEREYQMRMIIRILVRMVTEENAHD